MDICKEELWWYLETRKFGTCPHSGFGLGFERFIMFVTGMKNVRDVIAFPKTQTAACPLTDAPGAVSSAQLRELNIRLRDKVGQSEPALNPSTTESVQ